VVGMKEFGMKIALEKKIVYMERAYDK